MIRALPLLFLASPALASTHTSDMPAFVGAVAPLIVAAIGILLARRAMRARFRRKPSDAGD